MSSKIDKQDQIFSKTVHSYFSSLQVYHINHGMPLQMFKRLRLSFIFKGNKRFFLHTKVVFLPTTKKIFFKMTTLQLIDCHELNIDIAFKVSSERFMSISKINFTAAQQAVPSFKDTQMTIENISLAEFAQLVTLRLKTSKIDINHTVVFIVIFATHQQNWQMTNLCKLFFRNFYFADSPLSSQTKRNSVVNT